MKIIKKIVLFSVFAVPFGLPFFHDGFRELGEIGWYILIGIMLSRPLADVFVDFKLLRQLVSLRKEFGILCATLILAHGYGYFLENKLNVITELSKSSYWIYTEHLIWGTIGALIAFILLITSNFLAARILKKWWKPVQRTSYLFFILSAIHISLVNPDNFHEIMPWIIAITTFWLLAYFNISIKWKKPVNISQ